MLISDICSFWISKILASVASRNSEFHSAMWKKKLLIYHPLIEFFHAYLLQEMEMRSSQPFPDYQCMCFYTDGFRLKQRVTVLYHLFK